jgi:cell division protein FtsN
MNAFVIDEEQIKKVGIVIVGAVVIAFISGYYLGSKNSSVVEEHNQTEQQKEVLEPVNESQPVVTSLNKSSKAKDSKATKNNTPKNKVSKNKENRKKISKNKDTKDKSAKNKALNSKGKAKDKTKTKTKTTKTATKAVKSEKPSKNKLDANKTPNSKKLATSKNTKIDKTQNNVKNSVSENKPLINKKNTDLVVAKAETKSTGVSESEPVLDEKVYSIQAGMFSSEKNAKSFIEKLSVKKFDAYVSDFVSSSGVIKYNVRVGRFAKRDQARQLLKEFQKSFSSPAYVVITQ